MGLGLAALLVLMIWADPAETATGAATRTRGHLVALAARGPVRTRRGRPRKFGRPSRAVTLTLPDDVIARLEGLHSDLSYAVAQLVDTSGPRMPRSPAELVTFGDSAVIVVPRSNAITARTDAELVPLTDGRALLAFDEDISVPQFELQLRDALADPALARSERSVFEALADILQSTRGGRGVTLGQRRIVVLRLSRRPVQGQSGRRVTGKATRSN